MTRAQAIDILNNAPQTERPWSRNPGLTEQQAVDIVRRAVMSKPLETPLQDFLIVRVNQVANRRGTKRIRTRNGKFMTVKLVESDPNEVAKAQPADVWTTADKREVLIREMDTPHIINAMNVMYNREYGKLRSTGTPGFSILDPDKNLNTHTRNIVTKLCIESIPAYKSMHEELQIRLGNAKRPTEECAKTKRQFQFD